MLARIAMKIDDRRNPSLELYVFCVCALGLILYGYAVGVTNVMLGSPAQFQRDAGFEGDVETLGMLTSANSLGALIGCAIVLFPVGGMAAGDALGRIVFMRVGAYCFGLSSIAMALTPVGGVAFRVMSERAAVYWFGTFRMIYGIGMSFMYQGTAVYLAELTSQRTRGFYLPMIAVMTMAGDLVGNFVGMPLEPAAGGWRILAVLPAPIAVVYVLYLKGFPNSPRWLILKAADAAEERQRERTSADEETGKSIEQLEMGDLDLKPARDALAILRNTSTKASFSVVDACVRRSRTGVKSLLTANASELDDESKKGIDGEIQEIFKVVKASASAKKSSGCSALDATASRRAMAVSFGLVIFTMLSGVPAMSYFGKHMFEMTGHTPVMASSMTTALAFVKLLATIFLALSLETLGRRKMLLIGTSIQAISTSMLAYVFDGLTWIEDPKHAVSFQLLNGSMADIADAAIFLNAVGFHIGFWALTWTMANELSPLRTRSSILAINALFGWTLSIVTVRFMPVMMKSPGISATYGFSAATLFIAVTFIYLYVPETKGRSLEEVELIMSKADSLRSVVAILNRRDASDDAVEDDDSKAAQPLLAGAR